MRLSEDKVRERMREAGIPSWRQLVLRSKVSFPTIQRMLRGDSFRTSSLMRLAKALGCKPEDLLEE